jgi:thiol-disulfide isomerase/thioredoxin
MRFFMSPLFLLMISFFTLFADDAKPEDPSIGGEAPAFSLPDMDNEYVFLRDFCGEKLRKSSIKEKKVVVISFFSTTCLPCRKEIPQLIKLNETYKGKAVKILLLAVGENREVIAPYLAEHGISLPVLLDQYQVVAKKYNVTSLPRLVVIDPTGKVQRYKKGYDETEDFQMEMSELLDRLLVR